MTNSQARLLLIGALALTPTASSQLRGGNHEESSDLKISIQPQQRGQG